MFNVTIDKAKYSYKNVVTVIGSCVNYSLEMWPYYTFDRLKLGFVLFLLCASFLSCNLDSQI